MVYLSHHTPTNRTQNSVPECPAPPPHHPNTFGWTWYLFPRNGRPGGPHRFPPEGRHRPTGLPATGSPPGSLPFGIGSPAPNNAPGKRCSSTFTLNFPRRPADSQGSGMPSPREPLPLPMDLKTTTRCPRGNAATLVFLRSVLDDRNSTDYDSSDRDSRFRA